VVPAAPLIPQPKTAHSTKPSFRAGHGIRGRYAAVATLTLKVTASASAS
jgi:hypothetical protein